MTGLPLHPKNKGMNAALDIIEDTLALLKERVENKSHKGQKDAEKVGSTSIGSQSSTINPLQDTVSSTGKEKETSVLIRRKFKKYNCASKRSHHGNDTNSSQTKKNQSMVAKASEPLHIRNLSHISKESEKPSTISSRKNGVIHRPSLHSSRVRNRRQILNNLVCNNIASNKSAESGIRRCSTPLTEGTLKDYSDSQCSTRENKLSGSWVPPLSQSSPRELQNGRSGSNLKHMQKEIVATAKVTLPKVDSLQSSKSTSSQSYTEPTLTSRLRVILSEQKERDTKENVIQFIPSGTSNKSHHVGIIVQQQLGNLKNVPLKKITSVTESLGPIVVKANGNDNDSTIPTEEVIRKALSNIQEHIECVGKHSS